MSKQPNNLSNGQPLGLSNVTDTELFEDLLKQGIDLRLRVTGRSMSPILKSGDRVLIRKTPVGTLEIGDLIFFNTTQNRSYLHRIIKKTAQGDRWLFQTKGDAKRSADEMIPAENIFGKIVAIEKLNSFTQSHYVLKLESPLWRSINVLIARTNFFNTRIVYRLRRVFTKALRQPLQRIKRIWGQIL